jgi:hypothetical protein
MHTKKTRRQKRSKRNRNGGSRSSVSRTRRSLSHCDQKLMDMFKKYNTSSYQSSLETVLRELSKYHPLAVIEFIEMNFNDTNVVTRFSNETCFKILLNTLKQQLHEYKQKNVKIKKNPYEKFTVENVDSILKKGYATFSKSKLRLRGGAPAGDHPLEPPDSEPECIICREPLNNGRFILHPTTCQHLFHAQCLRAWWRRSPSCPTCRGESVLPPPSNEEQADNQMNPPEYGNDRPQAPFDNGLNALEHGNGTVVYEVSDDDEYSPHVGAAMRDQQAQAQQVQQELWRRGILGTGLFGVITLYHYLGIQPPIVLSMLVMIMILMG